MNTLYCCYGFEGFMTRHTECNGEHTVLSELLCHLPYAIFSVAMCLGLLSFSSYFSLNIDNNIASRGADLLFHTFHFMHIAFAATGTIIMFNRFSTGIVQALFIGIVSPIFFCMLSDIIFPYVGGWLLGIDMRLHICFLSEFKNVLPFLIIGIINGFVLSNHHHAAQPVYSIFSHFFHILVSSLASTFYLVSHGFVTWYNYLGGVFLLLIVAVVVPCSLSDVVVPMLFAKADKKNEKH